MAADGAAARASAARDACDTTWRTPAILNWRYGRYSIQGCTDDTGHRKILGLVLFILLAAKVFGYLMYFSTGTRSFSQGMDLMAAEHPAKFDVIFNVDAAMLFLIYAILFSLLAAHSRRAFVLIKSGSLMRESHKPKLPTNHWTGAAFRGIFIESSKSVMWAQNAIMASFAIVTAIGNLPLLIQLCASPEHNYRSKELQDYVQEQCGETLYNTCKLGSLMLQISPRVCGGIASAYMLMVVSTPVRFWSPVTRRAAMKENNVRMQRCIRWLLPVALTTALWSACQTAFGLYLSKLNGSARAFSYFFYISVMLFGLQVVGAFFFAGVDVKGKSKHNATVVPTLSGTKPDVELGSAARHTKVAFGVSNMSVELPKQTNSWLSGRFPSLTLDLSPGRRYYTDLLTMLSIYLYMIPEMAGMMDGTGILVIWLLRIATALLYLYKFEQQTSFDGLLTHGTGFGL
eukprot:scaffold38031_cov44-Prasinocladus_malaysianus.AAC.3